MSSSDFILQVFDALEKSNIEYAILRKVTEVENGSAHDVDVVIDANRLRDVIKIIDVKSIELGWSKFLFFEKDNGKMLTVHFYHVFENTVQIVHFDFFVSYSWKGKVLINNAKLLSGRYRVGQLFCASVSVESVTKLMSNYLIHGYVKDEYKKSIQESFRTNKVEVQSLLRNFLDDAYTQLIYTLSVQDNWYELEMKQRDIKSHIMSRNARLGLFKANAIVLKNLLFKFKRYLEPQSLMIAFIGVDGSGKSSIIDMIPVVLGNSFNESQIKRYHWRPNILPEFVSIKKTGSQPKEPHGARPHGRVVSFMKFMYVYLDYVIGYWFSVRIHLGKNELVIFDRYYFDFLIDKLRYRLNISDSIIKTVMYFIPKPDITFFLFGDALTLHQRKDELSIGEIERQLRKMEEVQLRLSKSKRVNVNEKLETVMLCICLDILELMKKKGVHKLD